jgi:hypothetical protein
MTRQPAKDVKNKAKDSSTTTTQAKKENNNVSLQFLSVASEPIYISHV